jgi:hypothetical protein
MRQSKGATQKMMDAKARALLEKKFQDGRISDKNYNGFEFGKDEPGKASKAEAYRECIGPMLVDNLNRNALLAEAKRRPQTEPEHKNKKLSHKEPATLHLSHCVESAI